MYPKYRIRKMVRDLAVNKNLNEVIEYIMNYFNITSDNAESIVMEYWPLNNNKLAKKSRRLFRSGLPVESISVKLNKPIAEIKLYIIKDVIKKGKLMTKCGFANNDELRDYIENFKSFTDIANNLKLSLNDAKVLCGGVNRPDGRGKNNIIINKQVIKDVELYNCGYTYDEIADLRHISRQAIHQRISKYIDCDKHKNARHNFSMCGTYNDALKLLPKICDINADADSGMTKSAIMNKYNISNEVWNILCYDVTICANKPQRLISVDDVLRLKNDGYTINNIAKKLNVSVSTVTNRIAEWNNEARRMLPKKPKLKYKTSRVIRIPITLTKSIYDKLMAIPKSDLKDYIDNKISDNLDDVLDKLSLASLMSVETPEIRIKIPISSDNLEMVRSTNAMVPITSLIMACINKI